MQRSRTRRLVAAALLGLTLAFGAMSGGFLESTPIVLADPGGGSGGNGGSPRP